MVNPPVHTYSLPGVYTTSLVITDLNNCKDTSTNVITVFGPTPNFTADTLTGCRPLLVNFTDASTSDSTLLQWSWNFGDGTPVQTAATSTVSHIYTVPGTYNVTMTTTDINNCTKTIVKNNYIQPTYPFPSFVADTFACKSALVSFNASATNVAAPSTFNWDFGDGNTSTGMVTTHAYSTEGIYIISLTVTDKNGCDSTIQKNILIEQPVAAFTDTILTESCGLTNVQFLDASIGTGINGWLWSFGDGASATQQNPIHSYTSPGVYDVTLVTTNIAGCKDTIKKNGLVTVLGPIGTFSFSPASGCNPLTVTFTALSSNSTSYTWDFGDGTVLDTTASVVQHTYTQVVTTTPILLLGNILSNGNPCQLPAPSAGQVVDTAIAGVSIDSSLVVLEENEPFTITTTVVNPTGTPTYSWTPSTGLSCTNCPEPSVIGSGTGETITYILSTSSPDWVGCASSDSIKFIFPTCLPDIVIPNIFTPNDDGKNDVFDVQGLCEKNTYSLRIFDRWGIEFFTSKVRKLSWDGRTTSGQLATEGIYYYIVTVDDTVYKGFLQLLR